MSSTNGTPADRHGDPGTRLILGELRDMKREFVEMRRELAEDRKRHDAEVDRYFRESAAERAGVTQLLERVVQIVGGQQKVLGRLADAVGELARSLRAPRNGRNGRNGHGGANGRKRK